MLSPVDLADFQRTPTPVSVLETNHLANHILRQLVRRALGPAGLLFQSAQPLRLVTLLPLVARLPANAVLFAKRAERLLHTRRTNHKFHFQVHSAPHFPWHGRTSFGSILYAIEVLPLS